VLASESLACLKRLHVKQKGRKHIATWGHAMQVSALFKYSAGLLA
jgi:hypothetical protein